MKRRGGEERVESVKSKKKKENRCIVDGCWYGFDDSGQVVIVVARIAL